MSHLLSYLFLEAFFIAFTLTFADFLDDGWSWLFESSFQSPCSPLSNAPASKIIIGYYKVVLILNQLTDTCMSQGTCAMEDLYVDENAFDRLYAVP